MKPNPRSLPLAFALAGAEGAIADLVEAARSGVKQLFMTTSLVETERFKEGLARQPEGKIFGSITVQHFLRKYPRLCGMTATARPAAAELAEVYGLEVVPVATHRPCIRVDHPDVIHVSREAKGRALLAERRSALLGHPPGGRPGGDPPRLEQHDLAIRDSGSYEGRRDTGRLAGSGRCTEDCAVAFSQRGHDLRQDRINRKRHERRRVAGHGFCNSATTIAWTASGGSRTSVHWPPGRETPARGSGRAPRGAASFRSSLRGARRGR